MLLALAHAKTVARRIPSVFVGHPDQEVEVEVVLVDPTEYWRGKRGVWPKLASIALYWMEIPTSSISVERVFGVMRTMETAIMNKRGDATFANELMFRCNKWVLEDMMGRQLQHIAGNYTVAPPVSYSASSSSSGAVGASVRARAAGALTQDDDVQLLDV